MSIHTVEVKKHTVLLRLLLLSAAVLVSTSCGSRKRLDPVSGRPAAPTGVTLTPGQASMTISWEFSADSDSFNVYWGTETGVDRNSPNVITNASQPYSHPQRDPRLTYFYVVTALNRFGESEASVEVSAQPLCVEPCEDRLRGGFVAGAARSTGARHELSGKLGFLPSGRVLTGEHHTLKLRQAPKSPQ